MTLFRSRQTQAFLALSCVGAVLVPAAALAQTPGPQDGQQSLGSETVTYSDVEETQGKRLESPKATRPVRDTPQTVTVLTGQAMEQQNLLTLREALQTVPGITFGAGEGGGGYGDSITLRGYSANTDITQDGVRDSAQYSRTDQFNTEQIEVTNGANSVTAGSGSVGGSINIVTKRPLAEDRIVATAGVGTDDYYRGTIDANFRVSDLVAVRLNAMGHRNDVPGRDVENYKRWGIAPSITVGIDGPTRLTVQYLHQKDDNIPQYGAPYVAALGGLLPGADISDYFGYRNVDTQESTIDQASLTFEHDFSDTVRIRNLTRWQDVRALTRVSPPQGTYCLASTGLQPNGAACPATTPPGYFLPGGPRGSTRDSRNQLLFNQLDLMATVNTGGIEHTITLGGAISSEQYDLTSGNWKRNADGTTPPAEPLINIANPNEVVAGPTGFNYGSNVWTGPVNFIPSARTAGALNNYAIYLFDTMKFSEQFELNAGVRYEHNSAWNRGDSIADATATSPGTVTTGVKHWNTDDLFSYRFGLVYKPIEAVSAYIAYGNSKTPSQSAVNGSCFNSRSGEDSCNVDPETAVNYEAGIKAELGAGVLVSAAIFRNERSNYKVDSIDPTLPDPVLDGKSRVNGFALGANGQITDAWSVTANYTYLESEVLQNAADGAPDDPQKGAPLTNVPKHSGSFFTTYKLPFGLQIGYGFSYQDSFYLNNVLSATNTRLYKVDDYLIHNAYLAYTINDNAAVQLNVKNFTDEKYFTGVRNGATANAQWARVGEGISAIGTLTLRF